MNKRLSVRLIAMTCLASSTLMFGQASDEQSKIATVTHIELTPTSVSGTSNLTLIVRPERKGSGDGIATGTVTFKENGKAFSTVTLTTTDTETYSVPSSYSADELIAMYSGDAKYAASGALLKPTSSSTALSVSTSSLPSGTVATAYSGTLAASGGNAPYKWSVTSGSLPAGLSLTGTGAISGTPTAATTANFTATVKDSSSPAQTKSAALSITVAAGKTTAPSNGTTWYVRPDGGTRYSTNVTKGQCNGLGDAPYPGSGVNQNCAFKDVRYLWQDGTYATDPGASFPAYGWVGKGGDTYILRGSLGTGVSYRIGWNNPNESYDAPTNQYWGYQGDPYDSGIPAPPSGSSSQHTRILGENYASCHAASAKTQLHGGYAAGTVLDMTGTSYVDVACVDITDYSNCGKASQSSQCNGNFGSLSDYSTNGIAWNNRATNDTLTDVHIHGMAAAGMMGATGTGMVFSYVDMLGNASSGWNADDGSGQTGTGTLLVQNFNIGWNGCAEEYPVKDAQPYGDCTDDNSGGYGDGFGTATTSSNPGWHITFQNGSTFNNTQDGLDALHLNGGGSTITFLNTLDYGNMGQQIKVGAAGGTAVNNVVVGNCNALRNIPGTPAGYNSKLSDYCRAADTTIVMQISDGQKLTFDNNTVYSAGSTGLEVDCYSQGTCTNSALIDYRNNIFFGFTNNAAHGYPSGGNGENPGPIYFGSIDPFTLSGSLVSNNVTYGARSSWTCPAAGESDAYCRDPQLVDESWHNYGYGDMTPTGGSVVMGAGTWLPWVTTDYSGDARPNPPAIGAYQ
jgi:hypothetical protein